MLTAHLAFDLARFWRAVYVVTITLAVYLNVFVAVVQAFGKIEFLHALASTGKEPPFLIGQLLALGLLVVIGLISLRHFRASTS